MATPQLLWDSGTAYDLFMSLEVLHDPAEFGVRGAWAAGVRARLPADEREVLEQGCTLFYVPIHWVHTLPDPKDSLAVFWHLGQVPAAERLPLLTPQVGMCADVLAILGEVAARGSWTESDREALLAAHCEESKSAAPPDKLARLLDGWAHAEEFGERYLVALRTYHEVFFAEEERRIAPALQQALARAQELAQQMALPDLVEELSQGVRFSELPDLAELVLAPSYWITPLVLFGMASPQRAIWLFGARPGDASLVPGETVPETMLRALKALSDPTRLRILHYLANEPLTPSELARRLRLRAPTVTHHLKALRLAGLVQLTVGEEHEDRRYAARTEAVASAFQSLQGFLQQGETDE
jgi:DNA-binding transcriptional ArsR family regulator